jgi:hypothetical protein
VDVVVLGEDDFGVVLGEDDSGANAWQLHTSQGGGDAEWDAATCVGDE